MLFGLAIFSFAVGVVVGAFLTAAGAAYCVGRDWRG